MRLEPIAPAEMSDRQKALHDEMAPAVEEHLTGFVSTRDDGALLGPFAPMLRWPAWGEGAWAQSKSLLEHTVVPKPAHEVAILVVGAQLRAQYELYAHQRVAEGVGLPESVVAAIVAGQRPPELDESQAAAYDLASALTRGGPVPDSTYRRAVAVFGDEGTAELIYLVAGYCAVSVVLNGFDVPVPGNEL